MWPLSGVWGAGVSDLMTSPLLDLTFSVSSGLDSSAEEGLSAPLAPKSEERLGGRSESSQDGFLS